MIQIWHESQEKNWWCDKFLQYRPHAENRENVKNRKKHFVGKHMHEISTLLLAHYFRSLQGVGSGKECVDKDSSTPSLSDTQPIGLI